MSQENSSPILCSTFDDPRGVLLDDLSVAATAIKLDYINWVVRTTARTDVRIITRLKELGVIVISAADDSTPIVEDQIENDHLLSLKHGLIHAQESQSGIVQYMDGDRAIMAAKYFPNDFARLKEMAVDLGKKHKELGYINVRRTQKDFLDHHPPLTNTEQVFNKWYSKVFGIPLDMGSTTTIMTTDVVETILARSGEPDIERVNFPQPLWLIIAKEMGARLYSDEIQNVLTYEAPEQNRAGIDMASVNEAQSPAQRYEIIQALYRSTLGTTGPRGSMSTTEWALRFGTEKAYLQLLLNHLDSCIYDPEKLKEFREDLARDITNIDVSGEQVKELLSQPPAKVDEIDHALARISQLMDRPDAGLRK